VYTKIIEHDKHEKHNKHSSSHSGVTSWGQSFELLLNDPIGLKIFAEFLKKEFSGENIYFWTACERYRQINDEAERKKEAIAIYEKHLANGALEPVNVDFNARNYSRDGLARAEKDLFSSAQKQIFNLMKFDSYQRFIRGELYKSCMHADQTNSALPYCSEPLDPLLKIITESQQTSTMSSKLKKSLSNAEDRRRKSLLPWHRKTRCKSKDREEEAAKNSNTLKPSSNNGDVHSSRSSLSSFDATISKMSSVDSEMRNSLCRVMLRENGASTIVQIKASETIRELVERVLEKRGFSYQAYEVFLSGTNKVRLTEMRGNFIRVCVCANFYLIAFRDHFFYEVARSVDDDENVKENLSQSNRNA
jgi:regulator of G-protein signaling